MAMGLWLCQTSVQHSPPCSLTGFTNMVRDLHVCQTLVPRITASCVPSSISGYRRCGVGLAWLPNIGATSFHPVMFYIGVMPMQHGNSADAGHRCQVLLSLRVHFEVLPIWHWMCVVAKYWQPVFPPHPHSRHCRYGDGTAVVPNIGTTQSTSFAYGVRQHGKGFTCVPNIGATYFHLLCFSWCFFGLVSVPGVGAMYSNSSHSPTGFLQR
jgi:hypothetical protein